MTDSRQVFLQTGATAPKAGAENGKRTNKSGLRESVSYVMQSWFPVNSALFREFQKKLKEGAYDKDRFELINDLKADFTIFAAFLKHLPQLTEGMGDVSPTEVLLDADIGKLKEMLGQPESQLSPHSMSNMVKAQAVRLKQGLITCNTAETVANKTNADPLEVYSCALIRQLGHNLLAWNYPRVYSRALSQAAQNEEDLDLALMKTFGFSPLSISTEVADLWRIKPELKLAMGLDLTDRERASVPGGNDCEIISKCCQIGETMGKIAEPEYYPSAPFQWKQLTQDVSRFLGPEGMQYLTGQAEKLSTQYQCYSPTLFEGGSMLENIERARASRADIYLSRNVDALRCGEELKEEFRVAYRYVLRGHVSTQALEILVGRVVPKAGFVRGCIYLADLSRGFLVPTLKIGNRPLNQYKPVHCSENTDHSNPLVEALYSRAPLRQEGAFLHNERVSHVSGVIGNDTKPGVLYLEMSDRLAEEESHSAIVKFRAIAKCLNECLDLA